MNDFYKTRMGMTFFEGTLPSLVRELKRLNDNLEASRELQERILASAEAQDKYQRDRDARLDAEYGQQEEESEPLPERKSVPGYWPDGGTKG